MSSDTAHDYLIQRLSAHGKLEPEHKAALRTLPIRVRDFSDGADLVRQGDRPKDCCLIIRGMACRYKIVSGDKRQILSICFTGDLPDLQSLNLEVMDHSISALTVVRAGFIPHEALNAISEEHGQIGKLLLKHALIDAAIFRDWIANVGRRSAYERIAHLFCEVYIRMQSLGLTAADSFRLPMTQSELGDATALSTVHVNRVLQQLRRENLISSQGDIHAIVDWHGLQRAGDFEESYLHQGRGGAVN